MSDFVTKTSGEREEFSSGSRRDSSEGKTRPDLIPVKATRRWGDLMARGAATYGERNWELGQPLSRFLESLERHILCYKEGERTEDHLSAILFNAGAMIHFEGTEWDDLNESAEVVSTGSRWFLDCITATLDNVGEKVDTLLDEQLTLQPPEQNDELINWEQVAQDAEKDWSTGPGSPWNTTDD